MNSRAYQHSSQQPHPHQQTHQPHQAHAGHPVAPYAAALQGQINPHSRPVFPQPGSQNAAPQAGAAGSGAAAGPGSAAGQMMHPSGGQMVPNPANQPPQSYQNAPPQQAIRSAFGQPQQVPQNRPQMQMHQSQQQQAQNAAAAAAAMQPVIMFPNYNQHHVVQHMYQANAGQPQPILSIPSSSIHAVNYQYPRMPFQAATSQPQMLNTYHMPHGYGHNLAYGQPYVLQQPQQPQAQQHPQQQQPGPQRGHPIPSPSPVNASNAGMIIQVQESGAKAVPPPHIPNAAAAPFKPREKKIAVLQDPNTMEIVDLVKPAAADSAPPATSQRSTPSVDSVKADTAADVPIPEPAKNLPNNAPTATIAVDFMNKVALAASEPVKTSPDPEPVPAVKSEPEAVSIPAARSAAEKPSLKQSNRDSDVKPVAPEPVKAKKEEAKVEPVVSESAAATDAKENVTPASEKTAAAVVKTGPRHVEPKSKPVVVAGPTTTSVPTVKPVPAQSTPPVVRVESEPDSAAKKSPAPLSKTPPAPSPPAKTIELPVEKVTQVTKVTKVNGEIPQPPKEVAPVVVAAAAAPISPPVAEVVPVVPVAKPAVAPVVEDVSRSKTDKGVFRYSREELVEFSRLPVCQTRPAELTDDKLLKMKGISGRGPTGMTQVDFMPSFMSQGSRGSSARSGGPSSRPQERMSYGGRNSQDMRGPPKKIIPSASLSQDVKLHTVENAWKPEVGPKKSAADTALDEEAKTTLLLKNFRGFLNKITPQKYDVIEGKIKELLIDTEDRLEKVLNLVFDKAVDEPAFCKQYAQLCQHLGSRHVTKQVVKDGQEVEEKVEFRRLLIQKCQHEFERDIYEGIDIAGKEAEIAECKDEDKKRLLLHELDEEKRRARKKSLGNMKLIGELYRLQMLKAVIMVNCIHKLISEIEDDNLECLCTLLRTIGQQLENETHDKQKDVLGKYFSRLNMIVSTNIGDAISARVKCLIKDILDLKKSKWQERGIHKENVPKTIDQIHKEVMIDAQKNRQDDLDYQQSRGDQRRGRPGGGGGGQSYGARSQQGNQHYEKDISSVLASLKLTQKKPENETMTLGPSAMGMWGQGSTGKAPATSVPPAPTSRPSQEGSRYASGSGSREADRHLAGKSRSQVLSQQSGRKPEVKDLSRHIPTQPLKSVSPFVHPAGVRSRNSSADNNRSMPSSRSSSQGVDSPQPVRRRVPELSPQRSRNKADGIISELLSSGLVPAAAADVADHFSEKNVLIALEVAMNKAMESSQHARFLVGELVVELMKQQRLVSLKELVTTVKELVEYADDVIVDVPMLWSYLPEILAKPCLELSADEGKQLIACALDKRLKTKASADFITGFMKAVAKVSSDARAAQLWQALGLSWSDYTNDAPAELVKKHKLEFLLSSSESQNSPVTNSDNLRNDCMSKLDKLLQSDPSSDDVLKLIRSNYKDEELTPKIASAFAITIIRRCLTNNDTDATKYRVDTKKLDTLADAVISLTSGKADVELETLHALQDLMETLMHPEKLSGIILEALVESDILTDTTVLSWWKNDQSYKEGKAMTICQAQQYLNWLESDVEKADQADAPENRK